MPSLTMSGREMSAEVGKVEAKQLTLVSLFLSFRDPHRRLIHPYGTLSKGPAEFYFEQELNSTHPGVLLVINTHSELQCPQEFWY